MKNKSIFRVRVIALVGAALLAGVSLSSCIPPPHCHGSHGFHHAGPRGGHHASYGGRLDHGPHMGYRR